MEPAVLGESARHVGMLVSVVNVEVQTTPEGLQNFPEEPLQELQDLFVAKS